MPEKESLIIIEDESSNSPFTFSLFATRQEVSIILLGIVTSKIGSSPQSYREETQLSFNPPVEEAKKEVLKLVERLSEKVLQRYPVGHSNHTDAVEFFTLTKKTVNKNLHL